MATTKKPAANDNPEVNILEVERATIDFFILGTSPLILNRMSQKVWFELLAPRGKKTDAEKKSSMKHDPIAEYRASPYIIDDPRSPTLLGLLPTAFKKAMGTAALDMPGAKKTQMLRLLRVQSEMFPVYGIPRIFMAITRSADMAKTPDVRTRAIVHEWATRISVQYTKPILRPQAVTNLLAAAGFQSGVGDWRQEKGSGSHGCFEIVPDGNADWLRIVKEGGRVAQQDALDHPVAYNSETEEMLAWFEQEKETRGFGKTVALPPASKVRRGPGIRANGSGPNGIHSEAQA